MESINRNDYRSGSHRGAADLFDPEIPVNIYELGLIYLVEVSSEGAVAIQHDAHLAALSGGAVDAG